ncbi:MAG TPA: hypothetical protein VIM53_04780 [Candidatus Saccharimonadales bacterium]
MDFQRRSVASPTSHHVTPQAGAAVAQPPADMPPAPKKGLMRMDTETPKWLRVISVILLFSLTVVVVGVVGLLHYGNINENKLVDTSKYQAVFLNNNQVYFGKIKAINSKYVDLQDIFYLNNQSTQGSSTTSSSTSTNTSLQLVKLGCEVHGPYDEMVINADQVTFWENLRSDGQVVTAIGTWQKENPNGQTCNNSNSSSSTNQSSTSTGSSSTSSTGSTSTSSTK